MGRTYVMGDIHGAYKALRKCLDRAGFDYEHDRLIALGDVCDGWPQTFECIEELLKIKNLVYILGNHDWWTLEWMTSGILDPAWFHQGGEATVNSYSDKVPERHIRFLSDARLYFELDRKLFVHAGFDPKFPIQEQSMETLLWDRRLARLAIDSFPAGVDFKLTSYDEVYLGHTPIAQNIPMHSGDIWLMDTGAGWSGALSMMDINTKEVFTSGTVPILYPGVKGRQRFS
ncbi:metallophosphoesterase [Pseudochryseolinea flava]|uniref:Phosphoesterase n=1 Tax=Pseudochryseolinea flava TaxID=2059302 RepID=A0A364YA25_9BACT|nr:metallophosphoesterase [Pseudochryseolinea flava]RAW03032.1 phosphoesterase [Pseudochryseolinea flava]